VTRSLRLASPPAVRASRLLPAVAFVCLAAVAAALVHQHRYDMLPCPWCVLQRLVFVVIALVALAGWALRPVALRRGAAALVGALALAGLAAALWQHFVAADAAACHLTLADRIVSATGLDEAFPDVFVAWASCADAKVDLLGLPYEFWSGALFIAVAVAAVAAWRRPA
jgi:disulfide bond formation protein DsbB